MELTGLQVFRSGYGWLPLAEGERLPPLTTGDTLRVSVSMQYKGPKQTLTLYGAVGTRVEPSIEQFVEAFDEALVGEGDLDCPESATFTPITGSVDIDIVVDPKAVSAPFIGFQGKLPPGTDYDLYVKIKEHPSIRDEVDDIIDLTAPAGLFEMIGPLIVLLLMVGMMSMMMPKMEEGVD